MPIASGSARRIAFIKEATFGTTPATPAFQILRATGGGPRTNKSTDTSKEIQADRNVRDVFLLGIDVAGDYAFELTYGTLDALLEGALFGAWDEDDILKNGVTPASFTFEEFLEMGATDSFSRFTGCMVNSLSLAIAARAAITGSLALMGQQETLGTAILSGATYVDPNDNPVSTASANVASLSVAALSPKVKSLNLQIANNLRTRPVVGSKVSEQFGYGRCEVGGTLDCYFESNALYQAVLDHGGGAVSFIVGNSTGEKYQFDLPKIIFGNGERQPGGNDDDVMVSIPFNAVYDESEACTIMITRAVA
jgi:hypothetical protein